MISSQILNIRPDGRFPTEMRKMIFKFGNDNNEGYVILSQGATTVKASIGKSKDRKPLGISLNFSQTSRNEPINERRVFELKQKLANMFSLLTPNEKQIEIKVDIFQDNGSLFSVIVNSITLALCFCGINMVDMCVSLTLNECVDLCYLEENKMSSISIVSIPYKNEILHFESFGKIQKSEILKCLEMSKEYCNLLYNRFRDELSNAVNI